MKKLLNFVFNAKKGQIILLGMILGTVISLLIGLILSVPIFWMGGKEYGETWMNIIAPYFFLPFGVYTALFLVFFTPYMWYISTSEKHEGDGRKVMKGIAIFCSLFPGAFIYSFIAKALFIPSGIHNLIGMFICGLLYLWIVKIILKKPFSIIQEFAPLC